MKKTFSTKEKISIKFNDLGEVVTYLTGMDEGTEESTRGQVYEIVSDLADLMAHNKSAMKIFSNYMGNKVKK